MSSESLDYYSTLICSITNISWHGFRCMLKFVLEFIHTPCPLDKKFFVADSVICFTTKGSSTLKKQICYFNESFR